ncbi:MAG: zinc metallopeptidase [Planctomycetota bacterium]|nr:zinc metallopeptidase [Planctomycetota bacterium]MEE3220772.1 zinc metallopeptidase [Planctomycetota bacterium]
MIFDPLYFLFVGPALLLGLWAQFRIKSTYGKAAQLGAPLSGAAAARHILDSAGLHGVGIEQIGGHLSDHYDPRQRVLRLSPEVYGNRSLAAVGIAAHEAGHAIQHAGSYAPLVVRNAVVPIANIGSGAGLWMCIIGIFLTAKPLILAGVILFATVVFFQLVNLPVEFNASTRAKAQLVELGIVPRREMVHVNKVLNAAALTYVAATLQSMLTLLYFLMRSGLLGGNDD